jgi:DNA-binding NarL/FixJ family response regulator
LDKAFTPAVAPKVELDAMEYQQQQADYWRTKYELERLQREKAEAEKKRRRAFTEREKTIMLAMNARGKAPGQIAAEIGRTASSVRTWLRTRT